MIPTQQNKNKAGLLVACVLTFAIAQVVGASPILVEDGRSVTQVEARAVSTRMGLAPTTCAIESRNWIFAVVEGRDLVPGPILLLFRISF